MIVNEREILQYEAIKAWAEQGYRGTLILPTGVGKTFIASTIAYKQISKERIQSALVVVPTINLIKQ